MYSWHNLHEDTLAEIMGVIAAGTIAGSGIPDLLAENQRLREALESLVKVAEPVFLIYDQEYEEHEMQAGRISPDGLFIALSSARAALYLYQDSKLD